MNPRNGLCAVMCAVGAGCLRVEGDDVPVSCQGQLVHEEGGKDRAV